MTRREHAPEGSVVGRGKIRVDARRAVAKLREHLLVDLHLYTLEIVRAAVAGGASTVDVEHDADDVVIGFDGRPLEEGTLVRLLDHVLAEATDAESKRIRLLAMGVNAALGLSPAYVDIYSRLSEDHAHCLRVRFTPQLLEAPDSDLSPMKMPPCETIKAPDGMSARGLRVEIRRRLGLGVVRRAFSRTAPRELQLLEKAAREIAIPLRINRELVAKPAQAPEGDGDAAPARALLRVPFDVRGVRRAVLEMLAPPAPPRIELLEHGVELVRYVWSFEDAFVPDSVGDVALPVRIVIDADELPTNASRSELRHDAPLIGLIRTSALGAFRDATEALCAVVSGRPLETPGVAVLEAPPEAFESALSALAFLIFSAVRGGHPLPEGGRQVLEAPLLRDALGRPVTPIDLLENKPELLYVWRGKSPVPEELSLWMQGVLWARGTLMDKVIFAHSTADASEHVTLAKAGAKRRAALLAHTPSEPVLPPLEDALARETFCLRGDAMEGLKGELALLARSRGRDASLVRVFIEERLIDTVNIDLDVLPMPLEIALAWEGKIKPKLTYEGVLLDEHFSQAIQRVQWMAVDMAGRLAERLGRDADFDRKLRPVLRAAVAVYARLKAGAGLGQPVSPGALHALRSARIWPTTEEGRRLSFDEVQSLAVSGGGAVCIAKYGAQGRAIDGRPVLAPKARELEWLLSALGAVAAAPYDGFLLSDAELSHAEQNRWPALERLFFTYGSSALLPLRVTRPKLRILIAPSAKTSLLLMHAGKTLPPLHYEPTLSDVLIAVDDDTIVPRENMMGVHVSDAPLALPAVERELCAAIVAALEGDATSKAAFGTSAAVLDLRRMDTVLRAYLIRAAVQLGRLAKGGKDSEAAALRERIEALPLVTELDEIGKPSPISLAALRIANQQKPYVDVLSDVPGFETLDWHPVVLPRESPERQAFFDWTEGRVRPADTDVPKRQLEAFAARDRRAFFERPALNPEDMGHLAEPGSLTFHLKGRRLPQPPKKSGSAAEPAQTKASGSAELARIQVSAALPALSFPSNPHRPNAPLISGLSLTHAFADILLEGRFVCRRAMSSLFIPVVARVNLFDERHLDNLNDIKLTSVELITARIHEAALGLAKLYAEKAAGPGGGAALCGNLRALRFLEALIRMAALAPPTFPDDEITTTSLPPWLSADELTALLTADRLYWPTVQGNEHPFGLLHNRIAKELYIGPIQYNPWIAPARGQAELDYPILLVPDTHEGQALHSLVSALGYKTRNVGDALAKLQQRRSVNRPTDAPTLAGSPLHPALRVSLAEGRVLRAEGQLEFIEGPASELKLIGLDGETQTVQPDFPFPLRVIARIDDVSSGDEGDKSLSKEITRAAVRHLVSLAKIIDDLPPFMRSALRDVVCRTVGQRGRLSAAQRKAAVFPDIDEQFLSLEMIMADPTAEWTYTTAPPPYPNARDKRRTLKLSEKEAGLLKKQVRLLDVSAHLKRELEAEQRMGAPAQAAITLGPNVRSRCVRVVRIQEDGPEGLVGEIGILEPDAPSELRGIQLFVNKKPLCSLPDGDGFALCAAINADHVQPNRWFDNVRHTSAADRIQERVRVLAENDVKLWLSAPPGALLERHFMGATVGVHLHGIIGSVWLPVEWPRYQPFVRIRSSARDEPRIQPFKAVTKNTFLRPDLPVCADLIVPRDMRMELLANFVLEELVSMVGQAVERHVPAASIDPYRWNLGLLGLSGVSVPKETTASGKAVGLAEVLGELISRGCVWVTRQQGWSEGAFPDPSRSPSFVLKDNDSALLLVLRNRGEAGVVKELGGLPAPTKPEPAVMLGTWLERPDRPKDAPDVDESAVPSALEAEMSWLERLRQGVAAWINRTPSATGNTTAQEDEDAWELGKTVFQALSALELSGNPVRSVVESKRGRAIRYDLKNKRLYINRSHPALAWLQDPAHLSGEDLAVLLAAIVSELNRALDVVTEAEERRALHQLMRDVLR